jgi:hypothetical protein
LAINYSDGNPCVYVYRQTVPRNLSDHFLQVASSLSPTFKTCSTRNVRTLHLGPKEYNPGSNQPFLSKREWCLDKGVQKEYVVAMLPELVFADKVLQHVAPKIHSRCINNVCINLVLITNANISRLTDSFEWQIPLSHKWQ